MFLDFAKQQHNEELGHPLQRDSVRRSLTRDSFRKTKDSDDKQDDNKPTGQLEQTTKDKKEDKKVTNFIYEG